MEVVECLGPFVVKGCLRPKAFVPIAPLAHQGQRGEFDVLEVRRLCRYYQTKLDMQDAGRKRRLVRSIWVEFSPLPYTTVHLVNQVSEHLRGFP